MATVECDCAAILCRLLEAVHANENSILYIPELYI